MPLYRKCTFSLLNVTLHPWSHSWPTEISAPAFRCLKTLAFLASGGSSLGSGRMTVLVEVILCLLGRVTVIGMCCISMVPMGMFCMRQCVEHPESAYALFI